MTHPLSKTSWKDFLPNVFSWLDNVLIETTHEFEPDRHYIIPVHKEKQTPINLLTPKNFPKDISQKILSTLNLMGHKHVTRAVTVTIEQTPITLIPIIEIQTTINQKGRQLGLDIAKHLLHTQLSKLTLCSSDSLRFFDIFDGLSQGFYQLKTFKLNGKQAPLPNKISVYSSNEHITPEVQKHHVKLLQGITLSRMVADAPPNWLNSEKFAEIAESMSKDLGIKCTILDRKKMEEMNMGAFLSVAKGTPTDPKLIAMEIVGQDPNKWVSIIGKGLTFDTGGISLKPSHAMWDMKYDMCGGASILGSAYYLAHHRPPVSVACIIGAVENMPSSKATRPGDIVTSLNGKTIEVLNTDAEGRLVLADLLQYAINTYKPEFMINTATLTCAVLMTLGSIGSALMSNNQNLADFILQTSQKVGEPFWQLPLWPEFDKEVKSSIADLKNITSSNVKAGTITAGTFLKEFVGNTPWCHLDIAGTGWDCKATGFPNSGATAFGMRTLVQACLDWQQKKVITK